MLKISGICKVFNKGTINEKQALSGLNLHLAEGDFVTVIGGNGAGKSTMLKILAGVRPPTRGTVTVPKGCTVAYLPQHLMTEDGRTVFEEASQAFAHLREVEKEIERMNE